MFGSKSEYRSIASLTSFRHALQAVTIRCRENGISRQNQDGTGRSRIRPRRPLSLQDKWNCGPLSTSSTSVCNSFEQAWSVQSAPPRGLPSGRSVPSIYCVHAGVVIPDSLQRTRMVMRGNSFTPWALYSHYRLGIGFPVISADAPCTKMLANTVVARM